MGIELLGANGNPIYSDILSSAARVVLYDSAGNALVQQPNSVVSSTQKVMPIGGSVDNNWNDVRLDRLGNIRPGNDLLWLRDPIEGATINSNIWTSATSVFTQAQLATTGINLNSGASLAANGYSIMTSAKQFPIFAQTPLRCRIKARIGNQTNALTELGFGAPATNTAQLTNGAYWRWTASGTCIPVLTFNSSDVLQGTDVSSLLVSTNAYVYEVVITDQQVTYSIYSAGLLIAQQIIDVPIAQPDIFSVTHIPVFVRQYITSTASPVAPLCYVSDALVQSFDAMTNKPWTHQLAATGLGGEVNPTTYAQVANWANSTAPSNATLANGTAGYSTLGGLFSFAAVAGAVTDYPLFGMAIPAPYSFHMTGVHISTYNNGAAVATSATLLQWGAFANSPAITLSSTGTIMRAALGAQSFPIGAAIGAIVSDLDIIFDVPLRTDSGKFAGIILRMPVGTATASQLIQGSVLIKGYFE